MYLEKEMPLSKNTKISDVEDYLTRIDVQELKEQLPFTSHRLIADLKIKAVKQLARGWLSSLIETKVIQCHGFDALMEKHNIHKYSTYSTTKGCIVDCFNKTLKGRMYREFTARGSHEWVSILPKLVDEYNNSKHRIISMTPIQADANPSSVELN